MAPRCSRRSGRGWPRRRRSGVVGYEQASRAIAAGADDVLVATDQGFEVRLPFTIARARKARATHDEVSTLCAVASKHAVLRYLEIDLRSDRLVRVGEVEPSSRRLASSAIEGRLASETFDDVSHGNLIRGAADAISRFQQSGELSAVVVNRVHRHEDPPPPRAQIVEAVEELVELRGFGGDDYVQFAADLDRTYREFGALAEADALEIARLKAGVSSTARLVEVPFFDADIHDLEALGLIVQRLMASASGTTAA